MIVVLALANWPLHVQAPPSSPLEDAVVQNSCKICIITTSLKSDKLSIAHLWYLVILDCRNECPWKTKILKFAAGIDTNHIVWIEQVRVTIWVLIALCIELQLEHYPISTDLEYLSGKRYVFCRGYRMPCAQSDREGVS